VAPLLPIRRFAQLSGLSVKALRHYDAVGLLHPASVDSQTGYRRYAPTQLDDAFVIRRLRALDLPVDDIRVVLRGGEAGAVLGRHRRRIEARAAEAERILDELGRPATCCTGSR
jgi:DNA-binding transcriptional MerR regulator